MPDRLMECSNLQSECRKQNPALLGRDVRLNLRRVGASARPQPSLAPKPLDAWFFEAEGVGCTCPRPVGLVASWRLNCRLYRGGLSFGSAGWAQSAARGCRAAVRRRVTRRGTCCGAREWAQSNRITMQAGMGAHVCPSYGENTRHGRQVMSEYGSYVTNVPV